MDGESYPPLEPLRIIHTQPLFSDNFSFLVVSKITVRLYVRIHDMKLIFPNIKKWAVPGKEKNVGNWLGILSILLTSIFYFFPFPGVLDFFGKDRVEIPGDSVIEQKLSLAKIEGVKYKRPSNAFVIAKPITLPVLNELTNPLVTESWGNKFILASVSPFKPLDQDIIFEPGQCRFLGKATHVDATKMEGSFEIENISCVDSRAKAYELTAKNLKVRRVGYVVRANDIGNTNLLLSMKGRVLTIGDKQNVIIVFDSPVNILQWIGKSLLRF